MLSEAPELRIWHLRFHRRTLVGTEHESLAAATSAAATAVTTAAVTGATAGV